MPEPSDPLLARHVVDIDAPVFYGGDAAGDPDGDNPEGCARVAAARRARPPLTAVEQATLDRNQALAAAAQARFLASQAGSR